ncbi:MAG: HAMP domain-containing histidine kinase [Calditrichae bacterium]|nr:HAMP domain-containing histidine kinase [Calditrichota bacterium]MCB9057171.1 HAMP domain-containing histidine kinase [Calditrichia bacterium]
MISNSDNTYYKLGELLIREKRFSEIGRLTSGMLHNLNTPISIIQGNAELLNIKYPDLQEIGMIIRQVERVNELVQEVGTKSKNNLNEHPVAFSLNDLIENELKILEANLYFKHNVHVSLELDKNLKKITAIYSEYALIVSALIKNAIDAMYKMEKRDLEIITKNAENGSIFSVKDSGVGMSEKVIERIFEPFYSGKPHPADVTVNAKEPRGVGIDLFLVNLLIQKYNFKMDINSEPGKGSEFVIHLPAE